MSNLTAKAFRKPLLHVMGNLSGMMAGVRIEHEKIYKPVFEIVGVGDLDQYEKVSNIPLPYRWVQSAFQDLRGLGLTERLQRGVWTITEAGIEELRNPKHYPDQNPLPEKTSPSPEPSESIEQPTEEASPVLEAESVEIGAGMPEDYHPDPYLRGLAIDPKVTPCFGSCDLKETVCQTCPAKNLCINATVLTLVRLTQTMRLEDAVSQIPQPPVSAKSEPLSSGRKVEEEQEESVEDIVREALSKMESATGPVKSLRTNTSQPPQNVNPSRNPSTVNPSYSDLVSRRQTAVAPRNTLCSVCGKDIQRGETMEWVRPKVGSNKGSRTMHQQCYSALFQQIEF